MDKFALLPAEERAAYLQEAALRMGVGSAVIDEKDFWYVRHCIQVSTGMRETLSIRLDAGTKRRLDALAKRSRRSKSFLAAEAIAAYVETEEWQPGEIQSGLDELGAGKGISHEKVTKWLRSWGKKGETKAPR